MQNGPASQKKLVQSSTNSDESIPYGEMPSTGELQASSPLRHLTAFDVPPIPLSPPVEIPVQPKLIANQYAMMLKAQSDREAAEKFRKEHESKKKACCTLF